MKRQALLYEKLKDNLVHCFLCAHHCRISDGKRGICGVRTNMDGTLYSSVYGEVVAANVDPIEKKPLYHFLPGTNSYSIATVGCNFRCGFCQNWQISQVSRKKSSDKLGDALTSQQIVDNALESGCKSISYTYTEPTIFFEYAYDISKLAKDNGLYNIFVTNGYMTCEALQMIGPYLDAANVDLKSFNNDFYKKVCGGSLKPVLDTIKLMKEMNIWVEITTLLIPGQNDSETELENIANFIAGVDRVIPWHISAFRREYKFINNYQNTLLTTLLKAIEIGRVAGLKHVHLGNLPLALV